MFKHQWCFVFKCIFCSGRFGRFPAVIDRRYRAALIFPRRLAAEGPEEGADGDAGEKYGEGMMADSGWGVNCCEGILVGS
jgi:hypothetical protein